MGETILYNSQEQPAFTSIEGYRLIGAGGAIKELNESQVYRANPVDGYLAHDDKLWYEHYQGVHDKVVTFAVESLGEEAAKELAEKVAVQLSQTEHLISVHLKSFAANTKDEIRFEDIREYIEYNIISFGPHAMGLDFYLEALAEHVSTISVDKDLRKMILGFLSKAKNTYKFDSIGPEEIEEHHRLIERWMYMLFSDEALFERARKNMRKKSRIPVAVKINKYGIKLFLRNNEEKAMLDDIAEATEIILKHRSIVFSIDEKDLSDLQREKLKLLKYNRMLMLKQGYNKIENKEPYIEIIEKWTQDELAFIDEVIKLDIVKSNMPLEVEKKKPVNPQKLETEPEITDTRKIIEGFFEDMDAKGRSGWEYAFRNKSDYDLFVTLLEQYFLQKKYEIPGKPIETRAKSKTQLATALGRIHFELGEELKSDKGFFEIARIIKAFRDLDQDSLYEDIVRHRGRN